MGDFNRGPRKDFSRGPRRDFSRGPQRDFNRGPREMFKAKCSECGAECEVPFKPSNDADGNPRPVYCKDCYAKRRPERRY